MPMDFSQPKSRVSSNNRTKTGLNPTKFITKTLLQLRLQLILNKNNRTVIRDFDRSRFQRSPRKRKIKANLPSGTQSISYWEKHRTCLHRWCLSQLLTSRRKFARRIREPIIIRQVPQKLSSPSSGNRIAIFTSPRQESRDRNVIAFRVASREWATFKDSLPRTRFLGVGVHGFQEHKPDSGAPLSRKLERRGPHGEKTRERRSSAQDELSFASRVTLCTPGWTVAV